MCWTAQLLERSSSTFSESLGLRYGTRSKRGQGKTLRQWDAELVKGLARFSGAACGPVGHSGMAESVALREPIFQPADSQCDQ
jgi:hypothetical protein